MLFLRQTLCKQNLPFPALHEPWRRHKPRRCSQVACHRSVIFYCDLSSPLRPALVKASLAREQPQFSSVEISEAIAWFNKIRKLSAIAMYTAFGLLTIGLMFDNANLSNLGLGALATGIFFWFFMLRRLAGDGDGGEKKRKDLGPPEIPS